LVKSQHTGARLGIHFKEVPDCFKITDGGLLRSTTDNAPSTYSMTRELQLTFEAYRIGSPALSHHIACMAQVIQITLGPFLRSLGAKGHTKSWDAHECDHHFGENARTVIRKGQILRHEGTARMNKVCAMAPGLAKLIEKVHRKRHFESSETNIHIAENACCTDYSDTWSSKRVH